MEEKRPKKLLDQVRDAIRLKHYSIRTVQPDACNPRAWLGRHVEHRGGFCQVHTVVVTCGALPRAGWLDGVPGGRL